MKIVHTFQLQVAKTGSSSALYVILLVTHNIIYTAVQSDSSQLVQLGLTHQQKALLVVFTFVSYAEARNRYRLDVCPSVCPSITRWYCTKTAEHIVMLSSPHDSPFILVLCVSRSSRNSDGVTPRRAAKQRWGIKMWPFSTNNLLYLRNGWRQMGIWIEAFYKYWILFPTVWHLPRLSQGRTQGKAKCSKKNAHSLTKTVKNQSLATDISLYLRNGWR